MNQNPAKMDSQHTGMWVNFFTAAGIPSDVSATYALTFSENRIQQDMLLDLNKEYLRDMGITRMGDVIAILRHSKQVHESAARDRVLSSASASARVPVAAVTGRLTANAAAKPSSTATRILEHYTRNTTPESSPPRVSQKRKPEPIPEVMDIKKSRLIRFGRKEEAVTTTEATLSKQTVFARLGTEPTKPTAAPGKPIFSRLGAKESTDPIPHIPVPRDALRYEGILKIPVASKIPVPPKVPVASKAPVASKLMTVTASTDNVRKIAVGTSSKVVRTMRADEPPLSVKEKLAVAKTKSVKFASTVEYKEIDKVTKSVSVAPKVSAVFNKPERWLTMPDGVKLDNDGVKARLGAKSVNNITVTKNVFKRLGV